MLEITKTNLMFSIRLMASEFSKIYLYGHLLLSDIYEVVYVALEVPSYECHPRTPRRAAKSSK
jgi:hypothetical protein